MKIERSFVTINLDNLKHNYHQILSKMSANERMACVVKANAYGHGDTVIAKELESYGVDFFCVASLSEALRLRSVLNKNTSILVLGFTPYDDLDVVIQNDIIQTITSVEVLENLYKYSDKLIKVHLALDTGMSRVGLQINNQLDSYIDFALKHYQVDGLFTHMSTADCMSPNLKEFSEMQKKRFQEVYLKYKDVIPNCHYKNSAAIIRSFENYGNLVRPGIILYGMDPSDEVSNYLDLKQLIEWKAVIASVRTIQKGDAIGYGASFVASKEMKIATIATGYADGYSRLLSNKGGVLINGKYAPLVGRVCMDQFMVDVTEIDDVHPNMLATLIGKDHDLEISVDDVANLYGTVNYDVVCAITNRVERFYIKDRKLV